MHDPQDMKRSVKALLQERNSLAAKIAASCSSKKVQTMAKTVKVRTTAAHACFDSVCVRAHVCVCVCVHVTRAGCGVQYRLQQSAFARSQENTITAMAKLEMDISLELSANVCEMSQLYSSCFTVAAGVAGQGALLPSRVVGSCAVVV